jgi:hypothetical protein
MKQPNPLQANPTMPSTSRDQTEKIPQSSSAGAPGVLAVPSKQSLKEVHLPTSTIVIPPPSKPIRPVVPTEKTDEQVRHALFLKVAAEILEEHGLCKRLKVLAKDGSGTVLAIRLEFDPDIWTEQLELR